MSKVDFAYVNGNIFTMDPSMPSAQAVACGEGKILSVGSSKEVFDFCPEGTEIRDLDGKFMFPGFIDAHRTLFLNVLDNMYFKIDPVWDLETTLEELGYYVDEADFSDTVFGYGFRPGILEYCQEEGENERLLDEISKEKSIILLSRDGRTMWMNTISKAILTSYMEDEGLLDITVIEAIEILLDMDKDEIAEVFFDNWLALAESGFTTTINMGSPECLGRLVLESVYSNPDISLLPMLNIVDSLFVNTYMDRDQLIEAINEKTDFNYGMERSVSTSFLVFKIYESMEYFTADQLEDMIMTGVDANCNIHIEAMDIPSVNLAANLYKKVREEGYTSNTLVIASDYLINNHSLLDLIPECNIIYTWNTSRNDSRVLEHSLTTEQAIKLLTVEAAKLIGMSHAMGSISEGKMADFNIYEINPLLLSVREFASQLVLTTLSNGVITYDANEEIMKMAFDMMEGQLI